MEIIAVRHVANGPHGSTRSALEVLHPGSA